MPGWPCLAPGLTGADLRTGPRGAPTGVDPPTGSNHVRAAAQPRPRLGGCRPAPTPAFRVGCPRLAPVPASPWLGLLASTRRPPPKAPANWRPPPPPGSRGHAGPSPLASPPGIGRGAPPAARPGLEGRSPQRAEMLSEGRSRGSRCDAAGPSAWPAPSRRCPPRTPSPTTPQPTIAKSRQPRPPSPVCLLYIPTDPKRIKMYGVTENGTGNGRQGTTLLCRWPVRGSKSHTKWATARAPLTDQSGLGEISSVWPDRHLARRHSYGPGGRREALSRRPCRHPRQPTGVIRRRASMNQILWLILRGPRFPPRIPELCQLAHGL